MPKFKKPSSYQVAKAAGVIARAGGRRQGGRAGGAKRRMSYAASGRSTYASTNYRTGGFSGVERKFLDSVWNGVTISQPGTGGGATGVELQPSSPAAELCISAPVQGVGEQELDGRVFTMKSIAVSGVVNTSPNPDEADVSNTFGYFFALVLDTQTNAQTINSEDVYLNPGDNAAGILPYPLRNLANVHRFRILDSTYIRPGGMYSSTDGTNTASIANQVAPVVKLNWSGNIKVHKTAATGVVGSIADNSVHVLAMSASSSLTPIFQGKARMRFIG